MRQLFLLSTAALMFIGCGKKDTQSTAAVEATKVANTAVDSSGFAKRLVGIEVVNWEPTSNSGAQFKYSSLKFKEDGTWNASAVVTANFEEFACKEHGTWTVEDETSNTSATMEWSLMGTTCITREKGTSIRVLMTLSGSSYKISFR